MAIACAGNGPVDKVTAEIGCAEPRAASRSTTPEVAARLAAQESSGESNVEAQRPPDPLRGGIARV